MATTVWRGHISFGLISIPVRLFRAARSERVKLRELYRAPAPAAAAPSHRESQPQPEIEAPEPVAPIRHVAAVEGSPEIVPRSSIVKGFEYERGRYVTLDPQELQEIVPKTATQLELLEFVHLAEVDPIYFETSYYVKPDDPGEKPYALLFESLRQTGLAALGRFAMHRREHLVILRPGKSGLIAHTMFFHSEVRRDEEFRTDTTLVAAKELQMANALVEALSAAFEPQKYRDTYREQLEKMIAAKIEGKQTTAVAQPAALPSAPDIMEALRQSLALVKKPPQAETPRSSHRKAKRR
jgi:DNA end-binding protein Ku